jgi:hypothetical protein
LESQRNILSKEECVKEYIMMGNPERYMKNKYIVMGKSPYSRFSRWNYVK